MIYNNDKIVNKIGDKNKLYLGNDLIFQKYKGKEPDAYKDLAYISNKNNNAWLDTGILAKPSLRHQIGFELLYGSGGVMISSMILEDDNRDYRIFNFSATNYFDCPGEGYYGARIYADFGYSEHTRNLEFGNYYIKNLNNGKIMASGDKTEFEPIYGNIALFKKFDSGPAAKHVDEAKIFYWKIYDGDILVRDFVPKQNKEGKNGLFDKVENKFYPSLSTNFIAE